jgi:hypothetical protein
MHTRGVFFAALAVALLTAGAAQGQNTSGTHPEATTVPTNAIPEDAKYACPMDVDPAERGPYFSSKPGKCPRCGMTLKPLAELPWAQALLAAREGDVAYTCPDHQGVFSTKAGRCPRCGKPLEPFKVMYTCPDPAHADVISTHAGTCPRCGQPLTPYRGIWLSARMADRNIPPNPEVAEHAAYRCPVHPLAHSDGPGKCPICGRDLEPAGEVPAAGPLGQSPASAPAKYVCPMHPDQVSSDARGTCPICGMRLVDVGALPHPTSAPAAIAVQMNYLMEHYLALQQRFASDRTTDVALNALGLVQAADEILKHVGDPGAGLPAEFAEAVRRLRAAALKTTGKDLEADRVTFVELSAAMRTLVEHVRPDRSEYPKIYMFHCPMTKGDWLQVSPEMANPFYGFKMLKCGEPQETR